MRVAKTFYDVEVTEPENYEWAILKVQKAWLAGSRIDVSLQEDPDDDRIPRRIQVIVEYDAAIGLLFKNMRRKSQVIGHVPDTIAETRGRFRDCVLGDARFVTIMTSAYYSVLAMVIEFDVVTTQG